MVVNEEKHIQHNPQTQEDSEGLAARFKRLSKTSSKLTIMRALEAGDCVLGYTECDFSSQRIGFEIIRSLFL